MTAKDALRRVLLRIWGTSKEELERKENALNQRIRARARRREEAGRKADDLLEREVAPETARRIKNDPTLEDFFDGFNLGNGGGDRCES